MGKPVDWNRFAKKAVAETVLSLPNELAYFFMQEFSLHQLLRKIRVALGNEALPDPTKKDRQNLIAAHPIPKSIEKRIREEGGDYDEVAFHFAFETLMVETVQMLMDYIETWAGADIDRLEKAYAEEFNEKKFDEKEDMTPSEKALLEEELEEAVQQNDLYQIYWLKRYLESELPGEQIALDRETAQKIMAVLRPVIQQFAGPASPSLSGAQLSGQIPVVDRNYRPLEVGQYVRVRWAYYHVNIRDDEGIVTKVDQYGGITIKTDHPVPHVDRNGFIVHEDPWIYYPAEYDYDRKVRRAAGYVGDGSLLGSMETFVEIASPKEWSPSGKVLWPSP